jgi:phosphatidylglycerol---prolipoprotein diacylglyceryl transferase
MSGTTDRACWLHSIIWTPRHASWLQHISLPRGRGHTEYLDPIYFPKMMPFLHFGWLTIPTYGLMVALAMLAAYFVLRADLDRRGLALKTSSVAESLIAIPCLAGLAGAKLYHELETPREFFADPLHHLFSQFGFAWFGALLVGFAAYVWVARKQNVPLLTMLDAGSPAAALGYGIGRIGCLLSGDGDYGIPTSLPWGMSFPNGLVPTTQRVHPTPIYEFVVACLIAWVLWRIGAWQLAGNAVGERIEGAPVMSRNPGGVFAAYLVLTGAARFLVEFIRINPRSFFGLTNAQAASAVSIMVGAGLWWHARKK